MILGINAFHGDVAAALLCRDGHLIAAIEEERYRRIKHYAGVPELAIRACLEMAGATFADVAHIAVSRAPAAHLWRKLLFAATARPRAAHVKDRARNARSIAGLRRRFAAAGARFHAVEHHPAHLASAFFASPFEDAAVCAIDGFGDFVSTSFGIGRDRAIEVVQRVFFPHSLGLLYSAVTQHLGFDKYGDEYKVMGLAPYGAPDFVGELQQLVRLDDDGRFALDLRYFRHWSEGLELNWEGEPTMGRVFTPRVDQLLGPPRRGDEPLTPRHEALAASIQVVFENAVMHILRALHARSRSTRLCLAGGCAMNSVANGKIREFTPFRDVYIQPAAGDNGTALGAALYVHHQRLSRRRDFVMDHAYWGPEFDDAAIARELDAQAPALAHCRRRRIEDLDALCAATAAEIASGKVIGWFQGRMEWGARALGNRSMLADPRRPAMREIINAKIKMREKFRPFAPSVLEEAVHDYFIGAVADPFMIQVYPVRSEKRAVIPAVTHVDGSGRLQTVSRRTNERYWMLLRAFERLTGVPVLLNTSFNENEPIVLNPREAVNCFLRTDMDVLVLGNHFLEKPAVGAARFCDERATPAIASA